MLVHGLGPSHALAHSMRTSADLVPSSNSRQNCSSAGARTAPTVRPHEPGRISRCEPEAMSVWMGPAGAGLDGRPRTAAGGLTTAGVEVDARSGGLLGVAQPMAAWREEARWMGRRKRKAGRMTVRLDMLSGGSSGDWGRRWGDGGEPGLRGEGEDEVSRAGQQRPSPARHRPTTSPRPGSRGREGGGGGRC